jgi:hypothetical protein
MRVRTPVIVALGLGLALAATPRLVAAFTRPDVGVGLAEASAGWADGQAPADVLAMRVQNPEYDFMARTFLVLALADRALAEPEEAQVHVATMDHIITDTLAQEAEHTQRHWLLGYADLGDWQGTGRSLFVDGEVLVMLGARRLVLDDNDAWSEEMQTRADAVVDNLGSAGSLPLAESYPDEGWSFCHTMALLGLRMNETLDGADHHEPIDAFLAHTRGALIHDETGLLISEFTMAGEMQDGPEGSSLWFTLTALRVVDPELAHDQYKEAKSQLGRSLLGMGYAKEWPAGYENGVDVDSGPIVPILGASASSSGLAIAAAAAFDDDEWHGQLVGALGAAEAVMALDPRLAEVADNPLGQAVVLWGQGFGPLWVKVGTRSVQQPRRSKPAADGER